MADTVYTTGQVARYLQIGQRTVAKLCNSGILPCFKINNDRRIRRSQLEQYLRDSGNHNALGLLPPLFTEGTK